MKTKTSINVVFVFAALIMICVLSYMVYTNLIDSVTAEKPVKVQKPTVVVDKYLTYDGDHAIILKNGDKYSKHYDIKMYYENSIGDTINKSSLPSTSE